MKHAALGVCMAVAVGSAHAARASTLYASANNTGNPLTLENIYSINQATGTATLLGNSGFNSPLDMTSDWRVGSFRLWACNSVTNQLLTIDPVTGAGTAVGTFGSSQPMNSIAFDVINGKMYGTDQLDDLYEINPANASTTFIGNVAAGAISTISALAFNLTGTLYGFSADSGQLVTIKTDTALAAVIGSPGVGTIADLAARPEDGAMFAVSVDSDSIYTVNQSNGTAALVGPHGGGVTVMVGLAFGAIPEPATVSMLALGALAVLRRRQER